MNSTRIPLQRSVPFRSVFLFVYVAVVLVEQKQILVKT